MNWFILFVAGLFEIGWAIGLKYTEGFTRLWPSVGTVASMVLLGDATNTGRLVSLGLIVTGVIGLKLATPA